MKKVFILKTIFAFLILLVGLQIQAQDAVFSDEKAKPVSSGSELELADYINYCLYRVDNGNIGNNWGYLNYNEVLWMNYYETTSSMCSQINWISVDFWSSSAHGKPFKVILYNDPDNDGDPDDAVYLTEANSTVIAGTRNDVKINPIKVSGGFFAAVYYTGMTTPSQSYPIAVDNSGVSPGTGWVLAASSIDYENIQDLTINNNSFDGALMVKAWATQEVQPTPISDYAIYFGIFLIIAFTAIRFRRSIF